MNKSKTDLLEARSEREYAFYSDYLLQHIRSASPRHLRGNSLTERLQSLNDELESLIAKNRAPKIFPTQMRAAFNSTQLPLSDFRWIDIKNERLCNWAWCYLKSTTKAPEAGREPILIKVPNAEERIINMSLLSAKAFNNEKHNTADRLTDILNAFYGGEANAQQQEDILNHLKVKWNEIHLNETIVNWLEENNPVHWAWAWSYLQNITQRPLEPAWIPVNDAEKKAVVIATIDLSDNVDRKVIIIDKMKKAWSQKKFREKSSGRKPYSISMTLNTKQKLNALAEENGMKINEMIEYLIRNEFKKRDNHE
ncbi:hypothetical protein MUS1_01375 [Marinomonas ushuaiensis DSM 15871]|uniref:Uncharacterized protein n=1 Tax=Marinomonas ushuaiensis DSM 15871 TaxID=1122207 RepID=X7E8V9_9GAMM|nr:hypothetical protein [Marinomonas ushuaiensis]ETX12285.1 hypothetical protein MUS1_01375 [Marinomonas ushuaiensis DSM 15871]